MMASAQVVKTSVNVIANSPSHGYTHPGVTLMDILRYLLQVSLENVCRALPVLKASSLLLFGCFLVIKTVKFQIDCRFFLTADVWIYQLTCQIKLGTAKEKK